MCQMKKDKSVDANATNTICVPIISADSGMKIIPYILMFVIGAAIMLGALIYVVSLEKPLPINTTEKILREELTFKVVGEKK